MPVLGDVLFVKSTEEPVTYIASRTLKPEEVGNPFPSHYEGTGTVYTVRRPIVSDTNGISYKFFDFLAEELETAKDKAHRQLADLKLRQELTMGSLDIPDPESFTKN